MLWGNKTCLFFLSKLLCRLNPAGVNSEGGESCGVPSEALGLHSHHHRTLTPLPLAKECGSGKSSSLKTGGCSFFADLILDTLTAWAISLGCSAVTHRLGTALSQLAHLCPYRAGTSLLRERVCTATTGETWLSRGRCCGGDGRRTKRRAKASTSRISCSSLRKPQETWFLGSRGDR